jgi:hypothetical protein
MENLKPPLFEVTLSEQEIEALNPGQRAMAKDWHLVNKKLDWIITKVIENNNAIVEHDEILETHRTFIKLFKFVIPIVASGLVIGAVVIKLVKWIWGTNLKP